MRIPIVGLISLAAFSSGCPAGAPAKAVRPDVPSAGKAVGGGNSENCMNPGEDAWTWTFDLDNTTRGALFSAMQSGLVIVTFDCKKLIVMSRCEAPGNYAYAGYPAAFDVLDFKDGDEVKASLTGGASIAAKFDAELKRGSRLLIAHGEVGMSTTTVPDVTRDQIKGATSCDKATHFVSEVHFGAYKMEASSSAQMKTAVDIMFVAGAGAGAQSGADAARQGGDPQACKKSNTKDGSPPDGCNTVVRVTLAPILPAKADKAPTQAADVPRPPPSCGPGMERVGFQCKKAGTTKARVCRPGDADDCVKQCEAGDAASCVIAGLLYERGTGVKPDAQAAFKYYKHACTSGNVEGCTGQAYLYSKGTGGITEDGPKAEKMFIDACQKGNGRACSGLGQRFRLKNDLKNAIAQFARGCQLGYARACFYEGSAAVQLKQDPNRTLRSFERACFGRDLRGCIGAAVTIKGGKTSGDASRADSYLQNGLTGLDRACGKQDGEACEVLADYYGGKYDPAVHDSSKQKQFNEQACQAGHKDACKAAQGGPPGKKGPPPPPPGKKMPPPPPPPPPAKKP